MHDSDKKQYAIDIPNLNRNRPLLLPISPDQIYHNGDMFTAILHYLYENDIETIIVVAAEARARNYQVALAEENKDSEAVKNLVNKLTAAWPKLNLETNQEAHTLCEDMKKRGKLTVMTWEESKNTDWTKFTHTQREEDDQKDVTQTYAVIHKLLKSLYTENDELKNAIDATVEKFFKTAMDKYKNDPIVQLFKLEKTADYIKKLYRKYVLDECAMMATWNHFGFTQMAYPSSYHGENTNGTLFAAVLVVFERLKGPKNPSELMQLLDIKISRITQEKLVRMRRSISRKGSLDSGMAPFSKKSPFELDLKKKIRGLQEEVVRLTNKIKYFEHENKNTTEFDLNLKTQEESEDSQNLNQEMEDLYNEIYFLKTIARIQAKELRIRESALLTLQQEKDEIIRSQQQALAAKTEENNQKDERIHTLERELKQARQQLKKQLTPYNTPFWQKSNPDNVVPTQLSPMRKRMSQPTVSSSPH